MKSQNKYLKPYVLFRWGVFTYECVECVSLLYMWSLHCAQRVDTAHQTVAGYLQVVHWRCGEEKNCISCESLSHLFSARERFTHTWRHPQTGAGRCGRTVRWELAAGHWWCSWCSGKHLWPAGTPTRVQLSAQRADWHLKKIRTLVPSLTWFRLDTLPSFRFSTIFSMSSAALSKNCRRTALTISGPDFITVLKDGDTTYHHLRLFGVCLLPAWGCDMNGFSYLASSDRERMCRQFTTAPASVPRNDSVRTFCQRRTLTQIHSFTSPFCTCRCLVTAGESDWLIGTRGGEDGEWGQNTYCLT